MVLPLTNLEQDMDLNYLYHRHQVSLYLAEQAVSEEARRAHRELASGYAARIAFEKKAMPREIAL